MASRPSASSIIYREALMGRLPILRDERPYRGYFVGISVFFAYGVATWAFLTGGYVGTVVNAPLGIAAFFAGQLLGLVLGAFSIGILCNRYGVELVDGVKATFGPFGSLLVLAACIINFLGWSYLLMVLAGQSAANILDEVAGISPTTAVTGILTLVLLVVSVALTARGPQAFASFSKWVAPALLILALAMFALLVDEFGINELFSKEPADAGADVQGNYFLVLEWGLAYGLSYWVAMGALMRLFPSNRVATISMLTGWGLLAVIVYAVGVLSAIALGSGDPTEWMVPLAGKLGGVVALVFVILANITSTVAMFYIAGLQAQQLGAARRMRWATLITVLAVPGIFFAFWPDVLLDNYGTFLAYNAVVFAPVAAVTAVDYLVLRKQRISVLDLFDQTSAGRYWFWSGVNPAAIVAVALGFFFYLWLFNPVTAESKELFRYATATIPTVVVSALAYYALMRLIVIPAGKGAYGADAESPSAEREPESSVPA
jgi:nucleobase:cation symporter-1, NCS1 family